MSILLVLFQILNIFAPLNTTAAAPDGPSGYVANYSAYLIPVESSNDAFTLLQQANYYMIVRMQYNGKNCYCFHAYF